MPAWPCKHKCWTDHALRRPNGTLTWTCTACGNTGAWTDSWGYFGNDECRLCQIAQIDFVWCSEECRSLLLAVQRVS